MCAPETAACTEMHDPFADGAHLNAAVAERILQDYPELWAQWQAKVLASSALDDLGPGGVRMYHSPTYLRCVVREYEHLAQGGDRPDPELEARCVAAASARPGLAERRRRELDDPWWRALDAPFENESIPAYYDPERLKLRAAPPSEEETRELREFNEMFGLPDPPAKS